MTFSTLIDGTVSDAWHAGGHKRRSRAGTKVSRIIMHHWAGTGPGGGQRLANPREAVSANYLIYSDGSLKGQVPEEYGPWTSGGSAADNPSITFEIQNSSGRAAGKGDNDPESWKISAEAWATMIRVFADIARRYFGGTFDSSRLRGHREFQATACPGGYLWSRRAQIVREVQAVLAGKPTPKPTPAPKPDPSSNLPAKGVAMLKGARLGDRLSIRDWWTYSDAALSKKVATVTGTFEIVGIDYQSRGGVEPSLRIKDSKNARRWVHVSAVDGKSDKALTSFGSAPAKPAKKTNEQIAREIVHGVNGKNPWGNDPQRSQKLRAAGYDPKAVQREVNKLL